MSRRCAKGPAIRSEPFGCEANLLDRFGGEIPCRLGPQSDRCQGCGAFRWKHERRVKDVKLDYATFGNCCRHGNVDLPVKYFPDLVDEQIPGFFLDLLSGDDARSKKFREKIQKYNNALSFTSLGVTLDSSVLGQEGHYVFRINGQLSHKITALMPLADGDPGFAQIFTYGSGGREEANLRVKRSGVDLDPEILLLFQEFMYRHNPYAKVFKSANEICNDRIVKTLKIKTVIAPGADHRHYNLPTANEVAAIVDGDGTVGVKSRDIVLVRRSGFRQTISELHTGYFALRYPLLFLYGSQMWHDSFKNPTPTNPDGDVSNLDWFAYLLFRRPPFSVILASGRLFQEFAVDMYVCVEHSRLQYLRFHQKEIRAEVYNGATEALGNEAEEEVVGQKVVLPSSFIGGPRHLQQLYQDAMSLVAEYGNPSLFITMTANPQWPEIVSQLELCQTADDRPDLVARVFYLKLHELLDDLIKRERLGVVLAYVYTIEFQKRGLPHCHLILFLDDESRPVTSEDVDCLISAQLPNPDTESQLFDLVTQHMLHGPCRKFPCWTGSECTRGFPRPFCEATSIADDSYPTYKRPDNGRHCIKDSVRFDNGSVVPYNRFLLLKFGCHINVEVAASIRSIKYLFKYILKGHDRTMAQLEGDETNNEILAYLNARFISAPEAIWRLLRFPIAGRYPPVQRLALHLEGNQTVYFQDAAGLRRTLETGRAERTTLTEFFRLCKANVTLRGSKETIRTLRYHEVPKYFVWNQKKKQLTTRKNGAIAIGRVYFANIKRGDVYYLRLLLSHVRGPTSFQDLRAVDGVTLPTFREAADKLGLLLSDQHYHCSLREAAVWKTGNQLRRMLAIILCHSSPANPARLWSEHIVNLSDDCEHQLKKLNPRITPSLEHIQNYGLYQLERIILSMESTLDDVGLPQVDKRLLFELGLPDVGGTKDDNKVTPEESLKKSEAMIQLLTAEQRSVIGPIIEALDNSSPYLAFLDGPGGTGKTFVLNCLLHHCNGRGVSFQAVSAAGIASLLLLRGRTAHSAFKIPIVVDEQSTCPISTRSEIGRALQGVRFIVWDKVAMQHKHAIECVDRTIRDITGIDVPFGGKVVLFAGDFRQTLPIVRRANLMGQAAATLKASHLWKHITRFALTLNIRLGGMQARRDPADAAFAAWLLELGSGRLQKEYSEMLPLQHCQVLIIRPPSIFDQVLVEAEYQAAGAFVTNRNWRELTELYSSRCIITPLNATMSAINEHVMDSLPGEYHLSTSVDIMDEAFCNPVSVDVLNSFDFPGFPSHEMSLKVGATVMVLRNLHLAGGLCNGTRLLITTYKSHALECRVLTGESKGTSISLPKMRLHHEGNENCPIPFYRLQFPVVPAFCMTINKSQGQSLERVTVLLPKPVFTHGQLYVALSRCTSASNVHVCIVSDQDALVTKNIVYHPVLEN